MNPKIEEIRSQIKVVIAGKDAIIDQVLTAILAGGHILLEDIPGVGKTTLALAVSKALGLDFGRLQFTPDVVPSDITGFTMYEKETGRFSYRQGAVQCNFFLADEINRTSSKTQSALLEVMQEGKVTVDGEAHHMPRPFVVLATQNPVGTAGTQMLPEAQLDRFLIKLSMGYPDFEAQIEILKTRAEEDPLDQVQPVTTPAEIETMKAAVRQMYVDEKIYRYITALAESTRTHELVRLGMSPRGALALTAMAKATAFMADRDYVVPEDVDRNFVDVGRHRILLLPKAGLTQATPDTVLSDILEQVTAPKLDERTVQ